MKPIVLKTPIRAEIPDLGDADFERLKTALTYRDERAFYEWKKFRRAEWYAAKHGLEAYKEREQELKAAVYKCLLFQDKDGSLWTYTGLAEKASRVLGTSIESRIEYPEPGALGWEHRPPFEPYYYQTAAENSLIEARHAGVEIGTGLGKTLIIEYIVKHLGLKTVVMAPSTDIAKRIYEDFQQAFGRRYVGFYGDGKHDTSKLIIVGISASLTRVEEGTEEWKNLASSKVFIADESHQCPASTLAKVCFGLMANAPYRFFFSATQLRQDGLDMLLDAITGPIVYRMTVREGIDQGFLARLNFVMVQSGSASWYEDSDVLEMIREHLYYNDRVLRTAASLINNFVLQHDKQVLVLVEEIEQFTRLLPYLRVPVKFAHGGIRKSGESQKGRKRQRAPGAQLPEMYHKSDPSTFVKQFNAGEFPVLVGTSCISTGTDVKANEVTVNLQGGKSHIAVMQGPCGRSTRLFTFEEGRRWRRTPGKKTECTVIDFDVSNIEALHRHADVRRDIYKDTYESVREITYG